MNIKAEELAKLVEGVELNLNKIYSMAGQLAAGADFNFVTDFQGAFKLSLKGANTALDAAYGMAKGKLHTLADVLYIREMESVKPKSDWRVHADAGRLVSAIKSLREFVGGENLSIEEGKRIIDFYTIHRF